MLIFRQMSTRLHETDKSIVDSPSYLAYSTFDVVYFYRSNLLKKRPYLVGNLHTKMIFVGRSKMARFCASKSCFSFFVVVLVSCGPQLDKYTNPYFFLDLSTY